MTAPMCSIGINRVGFGSGKPRILQSMKVFMSPTVRRLRSSSLLIDIWSTSSTRMTISIIVSESMPRSSMRRRSSSASFSFMRRSGSTKRSMTPMTTAGTCSALPVLRNCTAASKVDGEQRFKASRRAVSSSGANGFGAGGNGLAVPGLDWTASAMVCPLYVGGRGKVNPFLGCGNVRHDHDAVLGSGVSRIFANAESGACLPEACYQPTPRAVIVTLRRALARQPPIPPRMSASSINPASQSIFLITHEFYPVRGGIATFTEEIARATANLGYNVEVWAQSAPRNAEKADWPFRLRRLPLKGTHDLLCQVRLANELIRHRRNLRHATVYLPEPGPMMTMMLLQFFQAFRPRRLGLTFHGSEILKFAQRPLRRLLAGPLIRHATRSRRS